MGTYGITAGDRAIQILFSAVKVPILLGVTFALTFPSFFVISTLLGLRSDLAESLRALAAAQAVLAIVLASMAPFTSVWYLSTSDYPTALLFNALLFSIASAAGRMILRRAYRPLIARDARHRWVLRVWVIVYAFVGIQLGWVLRPFVGHPGMAPHFFRQEAWGNAYVQVARIFLEVLRGGR